MKSTLDYTYQKVKFKKLHLHFWKFALLQCCRYLRKKITLRSWALLLQLPFFYMAERRDWTRNYVLPKNINLILFSLMYTWKYLSFFIRLKSVCKSTRNQSGPRKNQPHGVFFLPRNRILDNESRPEILWYRPINRRIFSKHTKIRIFIYLIRYHARLLVYLNISGSLKNRRARAAHLHSPKLLWTSVAQLEF